ncbi:MAG TPA: methionine synthase [Actinomycetota bacterium]|nr:methionine synthase [Actinomycetota bacterium]
MEGLRTTTVGSFPKPDYLATARTAHARGELSREALQELERKATAEWIAFQDEIGIDLLVDGEQARGDMVAFFAEALPSMELGGLVRSYGNRYYRKPIITGELRWTAPMTVEMWRFAQGLTERPVKGMLTGPYTMVEWSFDEHYPSRRDAVLDMAHVVRDEAIALAMAGARYIQVDEPAIHTRPDEDFDLAVEALEVVVHGVDAEFHTHVCYGDVELIYPAMLRLPVSQISLAFKNTDFAYFDLMRKDPWEGADVGLGVLDSHDHRTETVEEVVEGIRGALELLPAERIWVEPDCGLKTRTVEETRDKLRVMAEAVRRLKGES